ncbi:MAG TPA: hypothetical protein VF756_27500 [Thermoanaerobaculia bacterium]
MSKRVFRTTIAAVMITLLGSVAGPAAAADFTSRGSSAAGFEFDLGQAWTWLTSAWTNLEKAFAQDINEGESEPAPATNTCTSGEAGCGIDPNG